MAFRQGRPRGSAHGAAVRLLQRRDHGRGELKRKLRMRGFSDDEIEQALESLNGQGLMDDASYALAFAKESLASCRGPKWISAKLRSRGVFAKALGITLEDETASLRALLKKRRVTAAALTDPKERARIMRFVMGRGYGSAAIGRVLCDFSSEDGG